ncbi:MAG: hypothetical protein GX765_00485 [Candidatus Moranbacteria bacterium]|nr:hypothetical protein [Candidatus Moranbacteria bacterium]
MGEVVSAASFLDTVLYPGDLSSGTVHRLMNGNKKAPIFIGAFLIN